MLPNSLKEKDKTLTLSDIISKKPTIKLIGLEKLKNRFTYLLVPSSCQEKNWIDKTEKMAKARVMVKSLFGDLKNGNLPAGVLMKKEPKKPGIRANKLALTIKIKKVATKGSIFLDNLLSSVTESMSFNNSKTKTFVPLIIMLLYPLLRK